jgi:hypothetical protein
MMQHTCQPKSAAVCCFDTGIVTCRPTVCYAAKRGCAKRVDRILSYHDPSAQSFRRGACVHVQAIVATVKDAPYHHAELHRDIR